MDLGLLRSPGRLWRTVRHLDTAQIRGRAFHALRARLAPLFGPAIGRWVRADGDSASAPDLGRLGAWRAELHSLIHLDEGSLAHARRFAAGDITLLGTRVEFADGIDWRHRDAGRLWAFELHYLDALPVLAHSGASGSEEDREASERLLDAWEEGNPMGSDPAWNPYVTSLRLVNLLRAAACSEEVGPRERLLRSAAIQATWLAPLLETHLGGNHLLANLKALLLATAILPQHDGLQQRLPDHLQRLGSALDRQFLSDGGHHERTPMYHAILCRDLRELCCVLGEDGMLPRPLYDALRETTDRAMRWNRVMRHPDGGMAFFNDANLRECCPPPEPDLGDSEHVALAASGYHRLRRGPWHLLWDCGAIGPDHQPGHSHADILSLELSLGSSRLFVNTGLRGYADDPRRAHVRSTAAHNTVQIASAEQIELWGCFRVGARGVPTLESAERSEEDWRLAGSYVWPTLPDRPVHLREIRLGSDHRLHLWDRVEGSDHPWTGRLLLHPEVTLEREDNHLLLTTPSGACRLTHTGGRLEVAPAFWHPRFGVDVATQVILLHASCDEDVRIVCEPIAT